MDAYIVSLNAQCGDQTLAGTLVYIVSGLLVSGPWLAADHMPLEISHQPVAL